MKYLHLLSGMAAIACFATDPIIFSTPEGTELALSSPALRMVDGKITFSSTIQNPSEGRWMGASLVIRATFDCDDGSRPITFNPYIGDLTQGDNRTEGSIERDHAPIEGCTMRSIRSVRWNKGQEIVESTPPKDDSPEERGKAAGRAAVKAINEKIERDHQQQEEIDRTCAQIFRLVADKKLSDLTVREDAAVRDCEKLGRHP